MSLDSFKIESVVLRMSLRLIAGLNLSNLRNVSRTRVSSHPDMSQVCLKSGPWIQRATEERSLGSADAKSLKDWSRTATQILRSGSIFECAISDFPCPIYDRHGSL